MPATPTRRTVEKFKPQPAEEKPLRCPNPECGRTDQLQILETAVLTTDIEAFDAGVTDPVVVRFDDSEQVSLTGRRELIGVRCKACSAGRIQPGSRTILNWLV